NIFRRDFLCSRPRRRRDRPVAFECSSKASRFIWWGHDEARPQLYGPLVRLDRKHPLFQAGHGALFRQPGGPQIFCPPQVLTDPSQSAHLSAAECVVLAREYHFQRSPPCERHLVSVIASAAIAGGGAPAGRGSGSSQPE